MHVVLLHLVAHSTLVVVSEAGDQGREGWHRDGVAESTTPVCDSQIKLISDQKIYYSAMQKSIRSGGTSARTLVPGAPTQLAVPVLSSWALAHRRPGK
jgi:hypothetical protein